MTDENFYEYINRRERELTHQIAGLKGQLEQIRGHLCQREDELREIQRVRSSLTSGNFAGKGSLTADAGVSRPGIHRGRHRTHDALPRNIVERFAEMTIKELVIQSLLDRFPNGGSASEIRDFIRDAYGRVIEPSSLRPQMHRLKADGIIGQEPSTDTWNFQDGKRRLYAMYDHPTSRKAMKELQDDLPGRDAALGDDGEN
jgi:hypothetical protein